MGPLPEGVVVSPDVRYRFGAYRLEPADARLWRGGEAVSLTPKAFDVLTHLVARAGRLVTKRELLETLWADVFVGDAALKVCIFEIRRALDDDPKHPAYIETVHRRGYRFVADVTTEAVPESAAPVVPAHPPSASAAPLEPPMTRYAHSGDVNIAYQVVGDGPIDLVFVMGWVSHLDCFWSSPLFSRFLQRLASFSRLILFDKRGTGLSDRVGELPTLEQRMDDVRAVMEAVGSSRAVLLGVSEGGPMCSLFAATYPEKTVALVMFGTYAKRVWSPDYPWAPTREARERFLATIHDDWGGPVGIEERAPSLAHDPAFRAWWATYLRMGASPGAAVRLTRMNAEIDVRHVLPSVRVPTLVLHRVADRCLRVEEGRYVASLVPGAQLIELPGEDHLPFVGDQDAVVDAIERFVTGAVHPHAHGPVLATVLVLEPTGQQDARAGDGLDEVVRREVAWFRGSAPQVIDGAYVATFDGPARAVRCALVLAAASHAGVPVRAGLHTGECVVDGAGVDGPAVEVARRIAHAATSGEVRVSRMVKDLVAGAGLHFEEADTALPGSPAGGRLYRVHAAHAASQTV